MTAVVCDVSGEDGEPPHAATAAANVSDATRFIGASGLDHAIACGESQTSSR
jgi:hypothetical protein